MEIKVVDTVTYRTFKAWQFGVGFVNMIDSRKPVVNDESHGIPTFIHRFSENEEHVNNDEMRKEMEDDCNALVELLKKFRHESEYVIVSK